MLYFEKLRRYVGLFLQFSALFSSWFVVVKKAIYVICVWIKVFPSMMLFLILLLLFLSIVITFYVVKLSIVRIKDICWPSPQDIRDMKMLRKNWENHDVGYHKQFLMMIQFVASLITLLYWYYLRLCDFHYILKVKLLSLLKFISSSMISISFN